MAYKFPTLSEEIADVCMHFATIARDLLPNPSPGYLLDKPEALTVEWVNKEIDEGFVRFRERMRANAAMRAS